MGPDDAETGSTKSGIRPKPYREIGGRARLLLVEPDPMMAQRQAASLSDACEVDAVRSCAEAVQVLFHDRAFHLVLCAAELPDGNARELLKRLRLLRLSNCPPVVVFGGGDDPLEVIEGIRLGARQYLSGAIGPNELATKVVRLLGPLHRDSLGRG